MLVFSSFAVAQQTPSLSLETALKALPNAPAYKIADLTAQSAQRQLEAAQANAGFNLTANGAYNTSRTDGIPLENLPPGTQLSSSSGSVSATAGLTVLPWSPAFDGVRAAERNLERANIDRLEARSQLAAQVVKQYFDLKLASIDLELARNSVKLAKSRLDIANAQLEAGVLDTSERNVGPHPHADALASLLLKLRASSAPPSNAVASSLPPKSKDFLKSGEPVLHPDSSGSTHLREQEKSPPL